MVGIVLLLYLHKEDVLYYFGLSELSRLKSILVLAGIALGILIVASILALI